MGDRSNIYLTKRDRDTGALKSHVDLYYHWGGSDNFEVAKVALKAAISRWRDDSYGTSLFLNSLFEQKAWPSGICIGSFDDNEYDVVEVCWSHQKVYIWPFMAHGELNLLNDFAAAKSIQTFEEFCAEKTE